MASPDTRSKTQGTLHSLGGPRSLTSAPAALPLHPCTQLSGLLVIPKMPPVPASGPLHLLLLLPGTFPQKTAWLKSPETL